MSKKAYTTPLTMERDFDTAAWTERVQGRGIGPDAQVNVRVKQLDKYGRPQYAAEFPDPREVSADPSAIVRLPDWLHSMGKRHKWRLYFYELGNLTDHILIWDLDLGPSEEEEQQVTGNPFAKGPAGPGQWSRPVSPPPWAAPWGTMPPQSAAGFADPRFPMPPWMQPPWMQSPAQPSEEVRGLRSELAELKNAIVRRDEEDRLTSLMRTVREEHAQQIAALRAELRSATNGRNDQPPAWVGALTTMAPLVIELMRDNRAADQRAHEAAESARREQINMITTQNQNQITMLTKMLERQQDPQVALLLQQVQEMRAKGGGDTADKVMMTFAEMLFGNFELSLQMYDKLAQAQPAAEPVRDLLHQALGMIQHLGGIWLANKSPAAAALIGQGRGQAGGQQQQPQEAQPAVQEAQPAQQQQTVASEANGKVTAAQVLQFFESSGLPKEWHTKVWATIVAALHNQEAAKIVGDMLSRHLFELCLFDALPELLEGAQDPANTSSILLAKVAPILPIWNANGGAHQPYVTEVCQHAGDFFRERVEAHKAEVEEVEAAEKTEAA